MSDKEKEELNNNGSNETANTDSAPETNEPVEQPDVYDIIHFSFTYFASHSWQSLGLMPSPFTKEIQTDLEQARVAIDCVAYLVDQLGNKLNEEQMREYRRTVQDLRINYVRQIEQAKERS